jgi:hypothetical protein
MGWATLSAAADRAAQRHLGGIEFSCNGITGTGFLLRRSRFLLDEEAISVRWFLTALTSDASSFSYGHALVANGQTFRVECQPQLIEDGTWCEIPLSDPISLQPQPVITLILSTTTGQQLTTTTGTPLIAL